MVTLSDIYGTISETMEAPLRILGLANMLEKLKTCYDLDIWKSIDTSQYTMKTNDIPGGPLFTKNMITGAFKADYALYVIDTSTDNYKDCFDNKGQEHAFLAFTLGVKQRICCLNKMDATTPSFAKDRYEEVKKNLSSYLTKIGYNTNRISFILISALNGDNIIERSNNLDWYKGETLLEAINRIQMPASLINKPLRMPIQLVTKRGSIGRVESGSIKVGMDVCVGPIGLFGTVGELEDGIYMNVEALPGDYVILKIENVDITDIQPGCIVSNSKNPAIKCVSFGAQMYVMDGMIGVGSRAVLECHTCSVGILFSELLSTVEGKTGKTLRSKPDLVKGGEYALVELTPTEPLIVERVLDHPHLCRFLVRDDEGTILAVGVITQVFKEDKSNISSVKAKGKKNK